MLTDSNELYTPEGRELLKEAFKPYVTPERQKEIREIREALWKLASKKTPATEHKDTKN